jgi:hypothetical protein
MRAEWRVRRSRPYGSHQRNLSQHLPILGSGSVCLETRIMPPPTSDGYDITAAREMGRPLVRCSSQRRAQPGSTSPGQACMRLPRVTLFHPPSLRQNLSTPKRLCARRQPFDFPEGVAPYVAARYITHRKSLGLPPAKSRGSVRRQALPGPRSFQDAPLPTLPSSPIPLGTQPVEFSRSPESLRPEVYDPSADNPPFEHVRIARPLCRWVRPRPACETLGPHEILVQSAECEPAQRLIADIDGDR